MEYQIIFNPAAGRGRAGRSLKPLTRSLEDLGAPWRLHQTTLTHGAEAIARELRDQGDTVVATGGDGTIHQVVNGLMGGNSPMGIIPLGGGNDLVRTLGIGASMENAVRIIRDGHIRQIDVGRFNGRYFINQTGLGFDADVVAAIAGIPWVRGFPLYFFGLMRALFKYRNRGAVLDAPEQDYQGPAFMVIIANGQFAGGGFHVAPEARVDDGFFDVCIFKGQTLLGIFRDLPKVIHGKHLNLPQVRFFRSRDFKLHFPEGCPVQSDGELVDLSVNEIHFQLIPAGLPVIVPGPEVRNGQ
ncbi:MAG TPA: diacylglycerol kinase family lipid kinase [Calditrichia bacterium]|nr:diacylglycerol kinase family lipid kinase [Calditrichota bacterium]HQU70989.1 diacylglycerol kinase family lipid kinase [Calditrichia bacterium]HQV30431.1 diacylglycerol kinase family lipid kinase [Calditrichia bacterium]